MQTSFLCRLFEIMMLLTASCTLFAQATSAWVYYDSNGNLQYAQDANGNQIIDYSWAGYEGGGVSLPSVAPVVTVNPSGDDDTANIQAAINQVSSGTPDANGFRGAVLLAPGSFNVSSTLNINTSGVVLAGSGSGLNDPNGTLINMTGSPFRLLNVAGSGSYSQGTQIAMTDSYIPSGATTINVADASGFNLGDSIVITRTVTSAWVSFMGMDQLFRNGAQQTWLSPGTKILTDRNITGINGNQITIDAPLTDSFDSTYLGSPAGTVAEASFPGRISQVGVEHFSVVAPNQEVTGAQYEAIAFSAVINGWVRDLNIQDTENSISFAKSTKQITLDHVNVIHTYAQSNSAAPVDFSLTGTQILANDCSVTGSGNTWPASTSSTGTGPIVLLNFYADDRGFDPHQRWSTGLLCDLCNFPNSYTSDKAGIAYSNRGIFGSGQGWDAGWAVAWNVTTPNLLVQSPPGVENWCIGCQGTVLSESMPGGDGTILPNGIYDSLGTPVTPGSLYLAQLNQRLGVAALNNIGYADVNGASLP